MQTLYGEEASDISELERTGQVPPGRRIDEFATAGCVGTAQAQVPSLWAMVRDMRAQVRDEILASPEMEETHADYASCAMEVGGILAQDPGDLHVLAAGGLTTNGAVDRVLAECELIWTEGYGDAKIAVGGRFAEANAVALSSIRSSYEGALETIYLDRDFLTYLLIGGS